ncbi:hypothetical protein TEK04_14820 [Klenkia sp. LSe6-5]|uniref:YGGT family protein n=1 Tax=Klenkia sesuvii TaxID=3103137 RepID=A0ABU8DW00_9ACTN
MAVRNAASRVVTSIAAAVRLISSVVGGLIVLYAVFVLFEANPDNPIVQFTAGVRDDLGGFTRDLFTPEDPKIASTVNALVAAIVWVVVGNLLSKVITRLAPRS